MKVATSAAELRNVRKSTSLSSPVGNSGGALGSGGGEATSSDSTRGIGRVSVGDQRGVDVTSASGRVVTGRGDGSKCRWGGGLY